ncbi:hypothetical protein IDJ75_14285 [Mucilaginibacter rigui]|uniref:Uncharacterized protein n=1 Tax=Mucilaginibacter rigui TaxID=534635 RepID=A0ABR7X8K9_9SPHI|nr:hypothetical protein [Mucilaginibacter rigui]MBD1386450.1 hypothetical protein [Mucilaginibacter rigui]
MKKALFAYLILFGGLLLSSCVKQNGVRITMDIFLKATTGVRKDIGTAD